MSAISEQEIESTLTDITSILNVFNNRLESLNEVEQDLASKASALEGYNGAKVANSDRSEFSFECTKYYYDKFNITGTSGIINSSNSILKETDRLQVNILSLNNQLKEMDSALAIITIYISNLEEALKKGVISASKSYDKMNIKDKLYYAGKLMEEDKKNDYIYLDGTAIIREGKIGIPLYDQLVERECKYLEFYNKIGKKVIVPLEKIGYNSDEGEYSFYKLKEEKIEEYADMIANFHHSIMLESNNYGENFEKMAVEPLKQITLEYIDYNKKKINNSNWVAYTNGNSYCTFDMKYYNTNANTRQFAVDSFSHELGHSFDNTVTGDGKFTDGSTYQDIYNQINKNDSKYEKIREYGHSSASECFAESTLLYYNDPAALKEIPLSGVGYDNVYEYMKSVLE